MKHLSLITSVCIVVVLGLCQCRQVVDQSLNTIDHITEHMDSVHDARWQKRCAASDSAFEARTKKMREDFDNNRKSNDSAFEARSKQMTEEFERKTKQAHNEFERKSKASQKEFEEDSRKMDEDFKRESQKMHDEFEQRSKQMKEDFDNFNQ